MSESKEQQDATKPVEKKTTIDVPELLGLVDFQCSNFVRLAANNADFRIAFGDLGPTGKLTPRAGFTLPTIVAKALHKVLGDQISKIESEYGPISDSPVNIRILAVKDEAEPGD